MLPLQKSLKSKLIYLLVASCFNFILLIILVIAMSIQGYTGFGYLTPMGINNCTHTYYLTKYNNFQTILLAIFIPAILAIIIELIQCVLIIQPLITQTIPTQLRLKGSYILTSLSGLSSIMIFGYFLTFQIDFNFMNNCQTTFVQTMLTILLSISSAIMLMSLAQIILGMIAYETLLSQQNYERLYDQRQNLQKIGFPLLTQFKEMKPVITDNFSIQQQIKNRIQKDIGATFEQNEKDLSKNQFVNHERYEPHQNNIQEQGNIINNQLDSSRKQEFKNPKNILQKYQNYIKKLNSRSIQQNEGTLIATIRGKYKN